MSDSTQQYILKQPIEGTFRSPEYYGKEVYEVVLKTETLMHRFQPVAKDVFEAMYQLLDIPAIEKQLDQIIKDSVDLGALLLHAQVKKELTLDECVERQKVQISDAVNQIKSLFGLENKETE